MMDCGRNEEWPTKSIINYKGYRGHFEFLPIETGHCFVMLWQYNMALFVGEVKTVIFNCERVREGEEDYAI